MNEETTLAEYNPLAAKWKIERVTVGKHSWLICFWFVTDGSAVRFSAC